MREKILQIIHYGILAPSGDNSQPWKFRIKDNKIFIIQCPKKDNPIYNFRGRGTLIAIGALIENIVIASSHFGFRSFVEYIPIHGNSSNVVAIITLVESHIQKLDPLFFSITKRATNRKKYEDILLTSDQKNKILFSLNEIDAVNEDLEIKLIDDPIHKKNVARAVSINELVLLQNNLLRKSLFENICWTEHEEKQKKHGLYIKTMELNIAKQTIFKLFRYSLFASFFNLISLPEKIAKENFSLYNSSAAIGVICTQDRTSSFVNVGRLVERIWLTCTAIHLSFQPITAIAYLGQRLKWENGIFSGRHMSLIQKAEAQLKTDFEVGEDKILAFIFRIGKAPEPSARCSRLPPEIEM